MSKSSVHAIVLAAGTSSRMGESKQLLPLGNQTLLETVIRLILPTEFSNIYTVIGKNAESIQERVIINDLRFQWIVNLGYEKGQSSSLKKGMGYIDGNKINVMIFLGDLPLLKRKTIQIIFEAGILEHKITSNPFVIRPKVKDRIGHPVFLGNIDSKLFTQLQGDVGAKSLLKQIHNRKEIEVCDQGIFFDIDTPEDYEKAKKHF